MTSVYSRNLQIYNAEQFKASVEEAASPYLYFTFGKIDSWSNENSPPQANTTTLAFNEVWKNMIGAKLIQGNDVRLGIRRHDWATNNVFIAYDDCVCLQTLNAANARYYVVTDDWNVYKCISNNNGSISTVKPTSTLTDGSVETPDRDVWKYMYTLTDEERLRFTTPNFIPVKTLKEDDGSLQWQVQDNAIQGSIEAVRVVTGGSGYSSAPIIAITGDGTGATAIARVNSTSSSVESIIITNIGSGYTYANVSITSTSGSGATARAVISPRGGHGSDATEELSGSHIIINPRLRGDEGGVLDVQNEFRQVAIIKNPYLKNTQNLASNLAYSQTTSVFVGDVGSDYQEDEIVYQGASVETASFKGLVTSWDPAQYKLELIDVTGVPTAGVITGSVSKTSRGYVNYFESDLQPYSGSLLYIDNITPVQRASDQTEDFKIVLTF